MNLMDFLMLPANTIGGSLTGSAVTGGMNMINSAIQNSFNERMMHEQMSYNSPQNQMKMMIAAGINPAAAAQGVSGSPASATAAQSAGIPQMPDFGRTVNEAMGNELTKDLLPALKRMYNANAQGTENDNIVTGDSSVIEARKQEYVNRARQSGANADILEAEAQYAPTNAYNNALILEQRHKNLCKELEKMNAEISKIGKEEDLLEAQTATEGSKKRNLDADSARQEWLNGYREQNGYDKDDPVWVKYAELMVAGRYDEAEKLLNDAKTVFKETEEATAQGKFEGSSPANKAFADVAQYRQFLTDRKNELAGKSTELYEAYKNGDIKFKDYQQAYNVLKGELDKVQSQIKSSDRDYRKGLYVTGTPTFWQDIGQQMPKVVGQVLGLVVGGKAIGAAKGAAAAASNTKRSTYTNVTPSVFNPGH